MAITIPLELAYEFDVKAKAADVFKVLAHVPTSASFFPKVSKLVDLGDNSYRWEMEKVGVGSVSLQTIYASKYESDEKKGSIKWTPIKGEGNAEISGSWAIKDNKKSTSITFNLAAQVQMPVPGMMKMIVTPIVASENEKLVEQYIDNLIKHFGGEA
jgi:carbon monoxide dehydrogenase subunit G